MHCLSLLKGNKPTDEKCSNYSIELDYFSERKTSNRF